MIARPCHRHGLELVTATRPVISISGSSAIPDPGQLVDLTPASKETFVWFTERSDPARRLFDRDTCRLAW